ncbi:hypothetical protein E6O75_ATG09930 [Venturia nashicola]|uniref:Uncharacterized protein n=1 Tax=Venturia nashicola TaxID=86259 RepID=A0A4Z1NS45_9PEZI|nr:hypothetical protein E6O75_ATG09930 [Venturia nashicola]
MKITSFFTMTALIANAVTALTLDQTFQPETLDVKMHELGKRAEDHPTVSPQQLQQAVAARCASLKGTTNEPDWCPGLNSIDFLCQSGPFETASGIVYYISQPQKNGVCSSAFSMVRAGRGEVVDVIPPVASAIEKKCLEPEQKGNVMCEEYLKSGKGVFHVKMLGEEDAEGRDFIFGEQA